MRHFISIVILILSTYSAYAQLSDADAFLNGTYDKTHIKKSKVKQVSVEIFIDGKKSTLYIFQFDNKGLLKKQTVFNSWRKKLSDFTFKYNKYGDQIERTKIDYELNKTSIVTFSKTYNGFFLVSEKSSQLPISTNYTYNSKGQIKEKFTLSSWDSINNAKRMSIYNYDTAGNLQTIKDLVINADGSTNLLETTTFLYETNGRIVSVLRENASTYYISYYSNCLIKSKRIKMPEDFGNLEIIENYTYSFLTK